MESPLDARLQHRNARIEVAAKDSELPPEDVLGLKESITKNGKDEVRAIEGPINGVDLKIKTVYDGFRTTYDVSLNGNELRSPEKETVYQAVDRFFQAKSAADIEHIDAVYEGAIKENEEFDQQRDPYNLNVRPLVDQLFGKKLS